MSLYIGVDGGLGGGLVAINDKQDVVFNHTMPVIRGKKTEFDIQNIFNNIKSIINLANNEKIFVSLEKAHVRPISGKRACFMTGYGFGLIQGILGGLNVSYEIVDPKVWQKDIFVGMTYEDTKQASISFCKKKWPNISWTATERSIKAHDGMTDAACIALYCYRRNRQ